MKQRKGWRMSWDVVNAMEVFENELWCGWSDEKCWRMSSLILQPFSSLHIRHSSFSKPPSLYLRLSSFSNPSVASPMSQFILQPFRWFTYVTVHFQPFFRFAYVTSSSLNSPGELPMVWKFLLQTSWACRGDWVDKFLNRNPCPETNRFRAAGTTSSK